MRARRYKVACLAGDGIGPELMAEASRAVEAVSRLHGFRVDEAHVPFGGAAVRSFGHPLPAATRAACREADAVLIAATREPALEGVKAELDLTWRITRVRLSRDGDVALVSPVVEDAESLAIERAFRLARSRHAKVTSVGTSPEWFAAVQAATERHAGVIVEHVPVETVLPVLAAAPGRFDVIVTQEVFAEALSNMAAFAHEDVRMVASGRMSADGAGVFGPTHGSAPEIAGQGVANPMAMLLSAALMLGEGLGERAGAETLERAVATALDDGVRTPDLVESGAAATTRQFMDVLLAGLPSARRDTEFAHS
ncbi:MAG TPA: isocitrate/isopropylmalate family dehydrogenase [Gaiellaceae bacterium]|jgi:3-isopropylmalate dehydrogenase|nr:isocitrate/isopropylmalate family dehydrogenase [Gaiellaceae bacterium]